MNDEAHLTEAAEYHPTEHKHGGLGQLPATAICGNDITSSCLYVSAFSILAAGKWAPLALLIVAGVLYLFRSVYAEVVGALPLNGGAYNALLNTTSKFRASIAACLTILSYMATAVISAGEAMHYGVVRLEDLGMSVPHAGVIGATIGLLAIFMVLTIIGITESAVVAVGIFLAHLGTLILLVLAGVFFVLTQGLGVFSENWVAVPPEASADDGVLKLLFFGFCAAMLGISGFESSSNFVEEQAEGVFPKTLRNMWIAVSFFNPVIAVLVLAVIPLHLVDKHHETLLAFMGQESGGAWLSWLVSIDAMLVLSGAVLTSFVGVTGLVRRLTLDRCLPQFLLKSNRRGTSHRIIISFFVLSVSVLFITGGEIKALGGVYTISFLGVMVLFGLGNILLKVKRATLPRPTRAPWPAVLLGIAAVAAGLIGTAMKPPPENAEQTSPLLVFLEYFLPAMAIISIMLWRITLLKICLSVVRATIGFLLVPMRNVVNWIRWKIDDINSQQIVFFTRGDNVANLNNAMLYVRQNEHTNRIKIVTVLRETEQAPEKLEDDLKFLDEAYPEIDIEYVKLEGTFGPELIERLSKEWHVPKNLMFIGSPGTHFMYGLAELGGVRLII